MKNSKLLRNRKAVSPVIATVILVAVTISVAIGVTYWMAGISAQFTSFEKIEIQSGWSKLQPTTGGWVITLEMKNSGAASANLLTVFINDQPVDLMGTTFALTQATDTGTKTGTNIPTTGVPIESGKMAEVGSVPDPVEIYIGSTLFSSGTTINIKVHSASGMDYIKLIKLN